MNQRNIYILSVFLLCFTSCVTILRHAPDDGYSTADKSQLSVYKADSWNKTESFQIVEIKANELKQLISWYDKTLVVMWATWCGPCFLEMPGMVENAKKNNIVFVCVDYDLKRIKKGYDGPGL